MQSEIYLDHSATTPVDPEVLEAMLPLLTGEFANASSIHAAGRRVRSLVEAARDECAALIGAHPGEIYFTSGGSESDNLAIYGAVAARDPHFHDSAHLVTSVIEHPAVHQPFAHLESLGYRAAYVGVNRRGRVDPDAVAEAITPETRLVSVMMANNEVGTLQPIAEIARITRERGVVFHVDAVQAVGKVPVDVHALGVDLLSFTAHKLHGPKGCGALYVRDGVTLEPLVRGGKQEHGLRGGTENAAGIVGFGKAAEIARRDLDANTAHLLALREGVLQLKESLPRVMLNGDPEHCLPHLLNLCFVDIDGLDLQANLSQRGICISVASACASGALTPSYVLKAMGLSDMAAWASVRFSLGRGNTLEQVESVVEQTSEIVESLRWITSPEDIGECDENCPCLWEPERKLGTDSDDSDRADPVADRVS